jgi:hypothetical protein
MCLAWVLVPDLGLPLTWVAPRIRTESVPNMDTESMALNGLPIVYVRHVRLPLGQWEGSSENVALSRNPTGQDIRQAPRPEQIVLPHRMACSGCERTGVVGWRGADNSC